MYGFLMNLRYYFHILLFLNYLYYMVSVTKNVSRQQQKLKKKYKKHSQMILINL